MPVAGVDEAGRGALAGPVVAAAVILSEDFDLSLLKDSKILTPAKREQVYKLLKKKSRISFGILSHRMVDKYNVLNATLKAMEMAVVRLSGTIDSVLIDGNRAPKLKNVNVSTIIKGDALVPVISAASICAKVIRDNIMRNLDTVFPEYGFSKHKGYGTKMHYGALHVYGPCDVHRKTFNLVKLPSFFE